MAFINRSNWIFIFGWNVFRSYACNSSKQIKHCGGIEIMIADSFLMAFRIIKKKRTRSFLTSIGIILSIATIFTLVSVSLGLEKAVGEQLRLLGTDKIFIQPRGQLAGPGDRK